MKKEKLFFLAKSVSLNTWTFYGSKEKNYKLFIFNFNGF